MINHKKWYHNKVMVWVTTHEWEKTHKLGDGWQVIGESIYNGLPMALLYNDALKEWSVQYAGTGHYFSSEAEANKWACERVYKS